jgi:hypothetical protein
MDRVTAIHKSQTAFVCGIIGFIPVFGLVPAIYALRCWRRISTEYGDQWNPAAAYLSWGARLACLGLLASVLLALAIGFAIALGS